MGWDEVEISNVCKINNGYAFKSKDYLSSGIPLVRISNFNNSNIYFDDKSAYLDESNLSSKSDFIVSKGDIVIALSGATTGKYGIYALEQPALLNQRIGILKKDSSENIDDGYFYHYLGILQKEILRKAGGAAQPNISTKEIGKLKIPLPPLPIQKKIAAILDAADNYRQKTKALIDKYDELTESIFLDMFGDPVRNEKGWEVVPFTDVMILKRGYDLPRKERIEGKVPVMASNGILDYHNKAKVNGGGIVTGRSGTLGKVHLIEEDYWPLNTSLYSKEYFGNNLVYLLYLLRKFNLKRFTRGAGVPTLNRNLVHAENIISVPKNRQQEFSFRINNIEIQKTIIKTNILKSENLFHALLQKAFNGELAN